MFLDMLEMRTYISDRFITKRQGVLRWRHPIGPNMMKIYNANIQVSTVCAAKNIGGYIYMRYLSSKTKGLV